MAKLEVIADLQAHAGRLKGQNIDQAILELVHLQVCGDKP